MHPLHHINEKINALCDATEVRGYGLSGDAHHITAPDQTGRGAIQCMRAALADAHLEPSMIGYVNAHATSTPMGDLIEGKAIGEVFGGGEGTKVAVSSTKGAVGHLLGAAGAVEAVFTILALKHGVLPPTLNLEKPEPELEECIDLIGSANGGGDAGGRKASIRAALSNSFGFGGTNAALCFGEYVEQEEK
jgi:3-oxoacyl-[acyl-carrier-protein] synthase II